MLKLVVYQNQIRHKRGHHLSLQQFSYLFCHTIVEGESQTKNRGRLNEREDNSIRGGLPDGGKGQ